MIAPENHGSSEHASAESVEAENIGTPAPGFDGESAATANSGGAPRCPRCNYDLSGTLESSERRCPECGRAWTIEELAMQQVAGSATGEWSGRLLWALAPGWVVASLVFAGFILQAVPILTILFLLAAAVSSIFVVINWFRDLYRVSFARGRSRGQRFLFVFLGGIGAIAANLIQFGAVVVVIMLLFRMFA